MQMLPCLNYSAMILWTITSTFTQFKFYHDREVSSVVYSES